MRSPEEAERPAPQAFRRRSPGAPAGLGRVAVGGDEARAYSEERLRLTFKTPVQVGWSGTGVSYCGYRILPGRLLLSRRRKRRYAEQRRQWENAYSAGLIDAYTLQAGYAAALAITVHADAAAWRREQLRRFPLDQNLSNL